MTLYRETTGGGLQQLGAIFRETSTGLLSLDPAKRETSTGGLQTIFSAASTVLNPSSLSVSWDGSTCGFSLTWTADQDNSQDIHRCSGSTCDPFASTAIDSVTAGTSSYVDTGPSTNSGDWTYGIRSTKSDSNTDTGTAGVCFN